MTVHSFTLLTYSVLSCPADCFQEISRMESELANLDSQIYMQQESVEAKDAKMRKIREQIDQVLLSFMAILTLMLN